ncbi:MAG: SRPBCC family protein [Sphingobium sp.]
MSETDGDRKRGERADPLVFDYDLDAPPEKVWRAISLPAFRDKWLPRGDLAEAEPLSSSPGEEVRYRMREHEPPFLESEVTFRIMPNAIGGTRLSIVHGVTDRRLHRDPPRANNDGVRMMLAA